MRKYITLFFVVVALIIIGLISRPNEVEIEKLEIAEKDKPHDERSHFGRCTHVDNAIKNSRCLYDWTDELRVNFEGKNNFSPVSDEWVAKQLEESLQYYLHGKKTIKIVGITENPHFYISVNYIDNSGGATGNTLAQAYYPQCKGESFVGGIEFDQYDLREDWSKRDIKTYKQILQALIAHELGHKLGLDHSKDTESTMYPIFQIDKTKPQLIDVNEMLTLYSFAQITEKEYKRIGIESHWEEVLKYDENTKEWQILISEEDRFKVYKNFYNTEFQSTCHELTGIEYLSNLKQFALAQNLRDIYNTSVNIRSSYRPDRCNERKGGAKKSFHKELGRAFDFQFTLRNGAVNYDATRRLREDIESQGEVFRYLFTNYPLRGIGLGNTFFHFDFRTEKEARKGKYTTFAGVPYDVWTYPNKVLEKNVIFMDNCSHH